jgi:hypothetical protein
VVLKLLAKFAAPGFDPRFHPQMRGNNFRSSTGLRINHVERRDDGGGLTIGVGAEERDEVAVAHSPDDAAHIAGFEDDGIGVAPGDLTRLAIDHASAGITDLVGVAQANNQCHGTVLLFLEMPGDRQRDDSEGSDQLDSRDGQSDVDEHGWYLSWS